MTDLLRPFRPGIYLILGIASVVGAVYALDARIDTRSSEAATTAVTAKWDSTYQAKALEACTSAADQGAYRAVSEAMQQTVIPMQRTLDTHIAVQKEHERQDEHRFRRLERKAGL